MTYIVVIALRKWMNLDKSYIKDGVPLGALEGGLLGLFIILVWVFQRNRINERKRYKYKYNK